MIELKKIILKRKNKIKLDKNLFLFLTILLIVGIISGSIFATILNNSDKILVTEHLNTFLTNIENNNLNYFVSFKNNFITDILNTLIIWVLGISIIGLPIIIIMYFSKCFILGFTIGSIFASFKLKGFIFALLYSFPTEIIGLFICMILTMYSISFSIKMIYSVFKRKTVDFKLLINKYLIILIISLGFDLIVSLYSSLALPSILKYFIKFIR